MLITNQNRPWVRNSSEKSYKHPQTARISGREPIVYLYSTYFQEYVDKILYGFDEQNRIYGTFPSAGQKGPLRLSEIKKKDSLFALMATEKNV